MQSSNPVAGGAAVAQSNGIDKISSEEDIEQQKSHQKMDTTLNGQLASTTIATNRQESLNTLLNKTE